jgi:AraC family transcriptional regulator of adaptative response/methylated-DNA-[protein]-cysteine methyltransferase
VLACATNEGICLLEFEERPDLEKQLYDLKSRTGSEPKPGSTKHLDQLEIQLEEYFNKRRILFELPLVLTGTDFQQSVWKELMKIPFGTTRSYMDVTLSLGDPKAIRAVAAANGANKIAIVIPCHRVLGNTGKLTGYAGGLWRKQWLLDHERNQTRMSF